MNVLAHLHLATLANSSLIGNVVADFVKGDPYQQFSTDIADGIMMHRRVDSLTDYRIEEINQAKKLFLLSNRRVAPIALDIIWDHFLAKNWQNYSSDISLAEFNHKNRLLIEPNIHLFNAEFNEFMSHLWQHEWLINYAHVPFIKRVLNGMANRRPKLNQLRETFSDFEIHYVEFEKLFKQFYPSLMQQALNRNL